MMLSTWPDWLRVVNLGLATIALVHLVRYYFKKRDKISKGKRDAWVIWVVIAGSFAGLAIDGILRHIPVTPRSLVNTLIMATLLSGIYVRHLWPLEDVEDENVY